MAATSSQSIERSLAGKWVLFGVLFYFLIACFFPDSSIGSAQAATRSVTSKEAQKFGRTKTYFVMTGDDVISDAQLKEAMAENWTLTPVQSIDLKTFEKLKTDSLASFVLVTTVVHPKFPDYKYLYLNLLMGSNEAKSLSELPEIAAIPFGCLHHERDPKYYLIPVLLRFLQQHATRIQSGSFWEYFKLNFDKRLTYYNRFNPELKGKTIYIETADMDAGITQEYLLLNFGKKVIRTDEKKMESISRQKSDSILIAFSIPSFNIILAPATGQVLYFNGKPGKKSNQFQMADMRILYVNVRERKNFLTN